MPFAQAIRGDTRKAGGEGYKRELAVSIVHSYPQGQTVHLGSQQMICLSTKPNNRDSYSLYLKSKKDPKAQGAVQGPFSVYSLIHIVITVTPKVLSIVKI